MLPTLKRLSVFLVIIGSLAFFGYLVYTGMGAKTKASISTDVAGNGEIPYSTEGLVAQWTFNEPNGTSARSVGTCGKSCDGMLVNFAYNDLPDAALGTGWTTKNKLWGTGALMFDGVNDYVALPSLPIISSAFTFETWAQFSSTNYNNFQELFNNNIFFLRKDGSGESNKISIFVKLSDESVEPRASSITVPKPGVWYHVVGAWDGITLKIYVNGILEGTTIRVGKLIQTAVEARIGIGEQQNITINPFSGILDGTRIFSRALSEKEIYANFQAQNGPTPIPQSLTATPIPSGSPSEGAQLLFKVRLPDISTSVGTVSNVKIEIKNKTETLFDFTTGLQRIQGTDYFSTPAPIEFDIPNGTYAIYVKQLKTIRRSFTVNLTRGKTIDCTQKNSDTSCQSLGRPELAPLFSGDSDGGGLIDSADLQRLVTGYGASPLPPEPNGDFNLDGKIDVQDLGILGKNFGKKGD